MRANEPTEWLWAELEALLGPDHTAALKDGFEQRKREYARRQRLDVMRRELPFLESQLAAAAQRYGHDAKACMSLRERIAYRRRLLDEEAARHTD